MAISSVLGSSALLPAGLGFRNVIINGAMQIAQRSTSKASITTGDYHSLDRWYTNISSAGTWTQSQSTDAPSGFGTSLKMQCTTANASLASSAYNQIYQAIEGLNVQQFAKGTTSAKPMYLSFWVKAFQTGTFIVALRDNTNSRAISAAYTINASATWEYKTIQIPADATGAFVADSNQAMRVVFYLGAGTDYTSGSLGTTWGTVTNANLAVGQTNVASSTNNYWQITGVQLEQNLQPTPFEQRPIGTELALCQRYYQIGRLAAYGYGIVATVDSGAHGNFSFPTRMRATPTITELTKTLSGSPAGYDSGTTYIDASGFGYRYRHGASSGPGNLLFDLTWSAAAEL